MIWLDTLLLSGLMFITGMLEDIFIALYIKNVSDKKLFRASIYSLIIGSIQLLFVIVIINNMIAAVFNIIGAAIGTYYSNKVEKIFKKLKLIKK